MDSKKLKVYESRKKAEEVLKNHLNSEIHDMSNDELLHELRTHQVELKLQNEELRESQVKLQDFQRKYWELFNFSPIGYLTIDEQFIIKEINLSGASLLKNQRKNLIGNTFLIFLTPQSRLKFIKYINNINDNGENGGCDLQITVIENNFIDIHIETSYPADNGTFNLSIIDISQTKQAEALKETLDSNIQINRTLKALRHNSFAMMHATNEISYLEEVCKIVVDDCGYSMVWIGLVEDEGKKVLPIVYAGFEEDYLKTLNITWDETENGQGPTGTAIRTGNVCICENMLTDPKFNPWREEAIKRGYASSIVLPLKRHEKTFGTLNIYSIETNPFSAEEKESLTELAEDISYGITSTRLRTENEKSDFERKTSVEFLHLINQSSDLKDLIHSALTFFKNQTGCEAVGIRLKEGDDYPYYEARGFPEEFLLLEDYLCEYDKDHKPICDSEGNPIVECMCGNIICGRFDPSMPFFTSNGSFWTNSTTKLLANTTEDDRQSRTRNRCNGMGYESVALIPLRSGDTNLGLLQINDKRKNKFSKELISIWERLAGYLSVALAKFKAEEKINEYLKELERSNKELEQFAYITSHDLREPLRMITSFLQLLERRYKDQLDDDANEFIEFAVDGAKRLDNMTYDLLEYSRISSQKREIKTIDFEDVLEEALINLKVPIDENNAVVTHDPLPAIKGDAELKVQLFQNIIGNSIKYRSPQETPKIHISASKEHDQYLFSIKDNGIGMSSEHLEHIFTIFKRLHTHDEYEGTGIGLAIAQKIVHQQGGEIWAESEPGKGTTFYFTIPI
jgi:signal transduction histidine kinase/putative methionine-R-sulfoxide reductase with GAF domain